MNRQLEKASNVAHPPVDKLGGFMLEPESRSKRATMADFWIQNGWYKTMRDGSKKLTHADWRQGLGIREESVRFLVEKVLKKDPKDITEKDFWSNRLVGLLSNYYGNSPYDALKEAGYYFHPWEMACTPMGFYQSKDNRIAAIRWLVDKMKKDPRDMTYEDFNSNRLSGLIHKYYNGSPYDALKDAGYAFYPWEMLKAPMSFYESKENRVSATRWLVSKLKKEPRDVTYDDFCSNRLCGLLQYHYNASLYDALKEAGYNVHPWEMLKTPNDFYKKKSIRILAIRWLVDKLKKSPRDIIQNDFCSNRLWGLLNNYYNGSPYDALKDAGLVTAADENYMRSRRHTRGDNE